MHNLLCTVVINWIEVYFFGTKITYFNLAVSAQNLKFRTSFMLHVNTDLTIVYNTSINDILFFSARREVSQTFL